MSRHYTWDVLDREKGHVVGDHPRYWTQTVAEQAASFYKERVFFNRDTGEVLYR